MSLIRIATVVEGQGEVQAVPLLLRRIVSEIDPTTALDVPQPWRVGRETLINDGGIESVINKVATRHGSGTTILVLFDADDDCPAAVAPALLKRALAARADVSTKVVLAMREFEAWFLAAAPSLAGQRALPNSLERPPAPE